MVSCLRRAARTAWGVILSAAATRLNSAASGLSESAAKMAAKRSGSRRPT